MNERIEETARERAQAANQGASSQSSLTIGTNINFYDWPSKPEGGSQTLNVLGPSDLHQRRHEQRPLHEEKAKEKIILFSLVYPAQLPVKSNQILFVTYTWLADVNASVAKCLCF